MTLVNKILILGAGQSAVYAASEIRKHDTVSIIKIFNEENYLPYERPPLSKDFLLNEKKEDDFLFFSRDFYEEKRIELINSKIMSVDFKNKFVFTNDNIKFSYDKLLIATGSINRQLKFDEVIDSNILYLRDIKDAKKIKEKISKVNKVAIIGGGFIGLEIASSLNQQNKSVNIIEISNQLMGRMTPNINNQPDIKLSIKQTFGIDSNMEVDAFSKKSEYVPEIDKNYKFDRDTTLAIISGFAFNKRVLVQGYHGTGKSTHIEQIAAILTLVLDSNL